MSSVRTITTVTTGILQTRRSIKIGKESTSHLKRRRNGRSNESQHVFGNKHTKIDFCLKFRAKLAAISF